MKTGKAFIPFALLLACFGCNQKTNSMGLCNETPRDSTICNAIYEPVCGCNNKTYGNACEAKARGITKFTEGECKPPAPKGV